MKVEMGNETILVDDETGLMLASYKGQLPFMTCLGDIKDPEEHDEVFWKSQMRPNAQGERRATLT